MHAMNTVNAAHATRGCRRVRIEAEDAGRSLASLSALLAAGVDANAVHWVDGAQRQQDLFGDSGSDGEAQAGACNPVPEEVRPLHALRALPGGFESLATAVVQHAAPERLRLLHRFAQQLSAEPRLWQDALLPERLALEGLARDVSREIHKAHAFIRFRIVHDEQGERRVAWFEPEHHILRAAMPFFVARFASMRWSVLSPRLCAHWDGALRFTPGLDRSQAPTADAGEALWLAYYQSIFNPSRLNTSAMLREMPRRYWRDLPETHAITALIQQAPERSAKMQAHARDVLRRASLRGVPRPTSSTPMPDGAGREKRLADLSRRIRHCSDCEFAAACTQPVWGEGRIDARLMIVGEQPGDAEDLAGRPFVGPAGQLLREALSRLGWPLGSIYLTNAVKHFRFELRGRKRIHKTPAQQHALACRPWLEAEIAQVRPRALLALGATAASSLLGRSVRVSESTGRWLQRDDGLPVRVVHHPAAVLRRAESGAPGFEAWMEQMRPAMDHDGWAAESRS